MHSGRSRDRTGIVSLVVTIVALIGAVVAVPSLTPTPLRDLVGLGPHRLAPTLNPHPDASYAFMAHQAGDPSAPVGYDPCTTIDVQVNLAGAPPDGLSLVRTAIARVEGATGLRFHLAGTTDRRPQWTNEFLPTVLGRVEPSPVLVSWATAGQVHQLAGNVAGIGGSVAVSEGGGTRWYVTGGITLDADYYAELDKSSDGRPEELAILLHEFGHVVGLAHVHDDGELMNADNVGRLSYGPGDLSGLAKIGALACR
ncbi:MAG: matrixin family metalloprotease [Marmoricola sp.]|nr:matrixin family metalloprotease [Marmoricola sp.]